MLLSLLNRPKSSLASQLKLIVNDLRIIHVTELTKQHDQVVLYVAEGDVGDKEQLRDGLPVFVLVLGMGSSTSGLGLPRDLVSDVLEKSKFRFPDATH